MNTVICTMGDVVKSVNAFGRLREERHEIKLSLVFRRVGKILDSEYENYIEEEKVLLESHALKDEEGEFVRPLITSITGEKIPDPRRIELLDKDSFEKEIEELFSVELELAIDLVPLSQIQHVLISPNDLDVLFFLFEDDISEPE